MQLVEWTNQIMSLFHENPNSKLGIANLAIYVFFQKYKNCIIIITKIK